MPMATAVAQSVVAAPTMGSLDHMHKTFDHMEWYITTASVGPVAISDRWSSTQEGTRTLEPHRPCLRMLLTYFGFIIRWNTKWGHPHMGVVLDTPLAAMGEYCHCVLGVALDAGAVGVHGHVDAGYGHGRFDRLSAPATASPAHNLGTFGIGIPPRSLALEHRLSHAAPL